MYKTIKKILKIILVIIIIENIFVINCQAANSQIDEIIKGGDLFIQTGVGQQQTAGISQETINDQSSLIYNTLFAIGVVASVIIGAILGIKFITGGIEEQTKVKEALIPYVIGCVIVFGAFGIWKFVVDILNKI